MNFLIVSDSFKGSLSSKAVASVIEMTIKKNLPNATIYKMAMADGGEGTVECLVSVTGGTYVTCDVKDPLLRNIKARYGILGDGKTAVMAMAEASGLMLLSEEERNPMLTSTFGVGQMVLDAQQQGLKKIILGIGGSATNDGGMGFLQALGWKFFDKNDEPLRGCGASLDKVAYIQGDLSVLCGIDIEVMCDVDNPLLGSRGATAVYSAQKGASLEMQKELERGMETYVKVLEAFSGKKLADVAGAGAAGGLGAALLAHPSVVLRKGFEVVKERTGIEAFIKTNAIDLMITGEGQMNHQTLNGKLPQGIAQLGLRYKIPVVAFVGSLGDGYEPLYEQGLRAVFEVKTQEIPLDEAMRRADVLLSESVKAHLHDLIKHIE